MTSPTAHDPYPHLRQAVEAFLLDCTKALAAFLGGDAKPLVVLVHTALAGGADLLADESVAKAWGTILASLRAEVDANYQRDTAAIASRALTLGGAVRQMTGKDLEEETALQILDRAGVSSGLWLFDEDGVQGVPESGTVAGMVAGGQAILDLIAKVEAATRPDYIGVQWPPPYGASPAAAQPIVPDPVGGARVGSPPNGATLMALGTLVRSGATLWWVDDGESDPVKRHREAVLSIDPVLVDTYENVFGKITRPGAGVAEMRTRPPEDVWGPALTALNDLRGSMRGTVTTPDQIAAGFLKAADILIERCGGPGQPPRPLALSLFEQGRFLELVELALPDATAATRHAIADALIMAVAERHPDVSGMGKEGE